MFRWFFKRLKRVLKRFGKKERKEEENEEDAVEEEETDPLTSFCREQETKLGKNLDMKRHTGPASPVLPWKLSVQHLRLKNLKREAQSLFVLVQVFEGKGQLRNFKYSQVVELQQQKSWKQEQFWEESVEAGQAGKCFLKVYLMRHSLLLANTQLWKKKIGFEEMAGGMARQEEVVVEANETQVATLKYQVVMQPMRDYLLVLRPLQTLGEPCSTAFEYKLKGKGKKYRGQPEPLAFRGIQDQLARQSLVVRYHSKGGPLKRKVPLGNILHNGMLKQKINDSVLLSHLDVTPPLAAFPPTPLSPRLKVRINFLTLSQHLVDLDFHFLVLEYEGQFQRSSPIRNCQNIAQTISFSLLYSIPNSLSLHLFAVDYSRQQNYLSRFICPLQQSAQCLNIPSSSDPNTILNIKCSWKHPQQQQQQKQQQQQQNRAQRVKGEGFEEVIWQRDSLGEEQCLGEYLYRVECFESVGEVISFSRLLRIEAGGGLRSAQQVISQRGGSCLSVAVMMMNMVRGAQRLHGHSLLSIEESHVFLGLTLDSQRNPCNAFLFVLCGENNYVYSYDVGEGEERLLDKRISDSKKLLRFLESPLDLPRHLFQDCPTLTHKLEGSRRQEDKMEMSLSDFQVVENEECQSGECRFIHRLELEQQEALQQRREQQAQTQAIRLVFNHKHLFINRLNTTLRELSFDLHDPSKYFHLPFPQRALSQEEVLFQHFLMESVFAEQRSQACREQEGRDLEKVILESLVREREQHKLETLTRWTVGGDGQLEENLLQLVFLEEQAAQQNLSALQLESHLQEFGSCLKNLLGQHLTASQRIYDYVSPVRQLLLLNELHSVFAEMTAQLDYSHSIYLVVNVLPLDFYQSLSKNKVQIALITYDPTPHLPSQSNHSDSLFHPMLLDSQGNLK